SITCSSVISPSYPLSSHCNPAARAASLLSVKSTGIRILRNLVSLPGHHGQEPAEVSTPARVATGKGAGDSVAAMRRWLIRLAVVVALVLAVVTLRATVFAPKPLEVEVIAAARGRVEETVTNSRA